MEIYKKRIIIHVRSNMAGYEKCPLPFVNKRTHPLHFSNMKSLPGTNHHIRAAWVICKMALNLWSVSQQTYDISEEDITAFVDRCLTHPRLKKFAKCPSWVSFSANLLWPVDQGIMWAANRISQGALFWDCCKNWSQMKTCTDCPCMILWQCFQLYGAQLREKPLLTVLWQLDSVQMQ